MKFGWLKDEVNSIWILQNTTPLKIESHVTETEFLSEAKTQTPWFQLRTENKNKENAWSRLLTHLIIVDLINPRQRRQKLDGVFVEKRISNTQIQPASVPGRIK